VHLRLGDCAFDRADYGRAALLYERALHQPADRVRVIAVYKLAWALHFAGRANEVRAAVDRLPPDADEEIRDELLELLAAVP